MQGEDDGRGEGGEEGEPHSLGDFDGARRRKVLFAGAETRYGSSSPVAVVAAVGIAVVAVIPSRR